jgi:hypothetical protein
MEKEVSVYQNTERKVQLGYLVEAVALANSNEMRTHSSARTSIGFIAKESYRLLLWRACADTRIPMDVQVTAARFVSLRQCTLLWRLIRLGIIE